MVVVSAIVGLAGLAAGALAAVSVGTAISIGLTVASIAYQQSRMRKMKAELDKRKQVNVAVDGEPFYLPVVYGKAKVSGGKVLHKLKSSYVASNYTTTEMNTLRIENRSSAMTVSKSGSKNEFLFIQQAICYGGIEAIKDITVDDKSWNDETLQYGQLIRVFKDGNTADKMATANGISSTNTFTNTAYASMVFRLNREEYNYNGSPNVSFFIEGQRIKDILYNPTTQEYSVSSTKTFSENPARVLLDYLTNPIYGRGLDLEFIDLESFYKAKLICDRTISGSWAKDGRVNGRLPDKENEDGTITTQPGLTPDSSIKLYECNVVLDTERAIRENIELILESMEEAELIWSGGVYKLKLDAPTNNTELEALVVAAVNEDDIIRGSMDLSFPDSSSRYNQCVVRFMNEFENFVDDTVTWPTAYSVPYNQYLEEDSGLLLKTEMYLPCTSDPYHALAKAEQMVRTSRREMKAKFTIGKKGLLLEPGDIISVTDSTSGLNGEIMKVEAIKLSASLTAEIEARQYSYETFAWNVPDTIPYLSSKLEYYLKVAKPANVTFTPDNPNGIFGVSSGNVTWSYPEDISVSEYLVELSSDNGVTWQTLSSTLANSFDVTGLNNGVYKFSVRSKDQLGKLSERVIAKSLDGLQESFTIQRATADQVAIIYADSPDAATNTQSYSVGTNKYNAYYVYSSDLPTLPIRSGISFSRFVAENSISIRIEIRKKPSGVSWDSNLEPQTTDPSTWPFDNSGSTFRNDTGEVKALVAFVYDGDQLLDLNAHYNQVQYSWLQGENIYVSNISGSNRFSRWVPVSASEVVADSQFICDATIA